MPRWQLSDCSNQQTGLPPRRGPRPKGYHGVALLSRVPLENVERKEFCQMGDTRHIAADVAFNGGKVRIHNFYVPAGGDVPDPKVNDKFAHKLQFLDEMESWFKDFDGQSIVVGD